MLGFILLQAWKNLAKGLRAVNELNESYQKNPEGTTNILIWAIVIAVLIGAVWCIWKLIQFLANDNKPTKIIEQQWEKPITPPTTVGKGGTGQKTGGSNGNREKQTSGNGVAGEKKPIKPKKPDSKKIVYTQRKEAIELSSIISSGGEGEIRKIAGSSYKDMCVKLYYKSKRSPEIFEKLKYMVDNKPGELKHKDAIIAWPLEIVYDNKNSFVGFVMYLAFEGSKPLTELISSHISPTLGEDWHKNFDSARCGKKTLINNKIKLMYNISFMAGVIHNSKKFIFKDLKPDNILVTFNRKITIVDMDSIQISENNNLKFAGTAMTPNYMPPEYHNSNVGKNPSIAIDESWDRFALGVILYQLIMGIHPYIAFPKKDTDLEPTIFNSIKLNLFPFGENKAAVGSYPEKQHNNFYMLPKPIQQLFIRCFSNNFDNRPSDREWVTTLKKVIDSFK